MRMDDTSPLPFPQRARLSDQVLTFLQQEISKGRWREMLPPESELCRELKVSRDTLRKAIGHLTRENWIVPGGRGSRHRIRPCEIKSTAPVRRRGSIIRFLTPYHPQEMGGSDQHLRRSISERIGGAGYWIELEHRPGQFKELREEELARLDEHPDTAGWILCFATEALQRWFQERKRPVVVLGPLHSGVKLASIYPDTQAIARHVHGLLSARGHRHVAYLIDELTGLGDRRCAEELSNVAISNGDRVDVLLHGRSRASVCRTLAAALARQPSPTAFISCCPEHCVSTLCYLQAVGVEVPNEVSVVCGWDDFMLDFTVPPITRYRTDAETLGRKVGELLLDQINQGVGKTRVIGLMPELVTGGTLGRRG